MDNESISGKSTDGSQRKSFSIKVFKDSKSQKHLRHHTSESGSDAAVSTTLTSPMSPFADIETAEPEQVFAFVPPPPPAIDVSRRTSMQPSPINPNQLKHTRPTSILVTPPETLGRNLGSIDEMKSPQSDFLMDTSFFESKLGSGIARNIPAPLAAADSDYPRFPDGDGELRSLFMGRRVCISFYSIGFSFVLIGYQYQIYRALGMHMDHRTKSRWSLITCLACRQN